MCKSCTTEWKCGLLYEMLDHHVTFYATIFVWGGGDLLGLKFMQSSDNESAMLIDGIHLKNVSR